MLALTYVLSICSVVNIIAHELKFGRLFAILN